MKYRSKYLIFTLAIFFLLPVWESAEVSGQEKIVSPIFLRFKITEPIDKRFRVIVGGFRHTSKPSWYFPSISAEADGGVWSDWIDLSNWAWRGKINRSGGIAEWDSVKLAAARIGSKQTVSDSVFDVQLADAPGDQNIIVSFTEKSASNTVAFLVPTPLRENVKEFETGSQMAARHTQWAKEAVGDKPILLKKFDIITSLWRHYDSSLALREALSLRSLGFNVLGNADPSILRETGMRTYGNTWLYNPDPEAVAVQWKTFAENKLAKLPAETSAKQSYWVISDEVSALDFRKIAPAKLDDWFRAYLINKGVTADDLGKPIDQINYPADAMYKPTLPKDALLPTRRLMYYAAKFGQWWSAKQLRQTSDLIQGSMPQMKTEALMPSHGFLGNAWGPANIGMSYRMLDIFELGAQQSVSELSAEDWLGLNHMYGSNYTWSGGQTFGYYNAILRSAMVGKPMMLRGLITPSDDEYLRLKAFSSLGQGAKSFFFWTFGPTYIGTENYWSDLRSEYDGIAKLNRTLEKAEDVLYPANTVTDPVAILYSVSHDIWDTDNHTAFAEKRLLWHALRHLQIQPNFLREEDIEAGRLKDYKVLYITDWCISRKASAAIDKWVKRGGILYLSAGAATRDEFYEPYSPPFAEAVWGGNAAQKLFTEPHNYNERTDLPRIKPLTTVDVRVNEQQFNLPVIGSRIELEQNGKPFAIFKDGKTAGTTLSYGRGQIIAVGFLPMLAYGQLADFKPTTLEEKWKPEARSIIKIALDAAKIAPVAASDVPIVETNLLTGSNGSALVLANYTYQPITSLTIDLKLVRRVKQAVSVEGNSVKLQMINGSTGRIHLTLPLKWTDIILLK
ncbi:MAG: hypothetical protein ACR2HG_06745 [Pyrinomonadaceae bacterium]